MTTLPPIPPDGVPQIIRASKRASWTQRARHGHYRADAADHDGQPAHAAWHRRYADLAQDVADAIHTYGFRSPDHRAALAAVDAEAAFRDRLNRTAP